MIGQVEVPEILIGPKVQAVSDILADRSDPERSRVEAARYILQNCVKKGALPKRIKLNETDAVRTIRRYAHHFLDQGDYASAAILYWPGGALFNPRPRSVRLVWQAIQQTSKLLIPGAASMGKSYTIGVYYLLDYERDPEYTCVKVASATGTHAKTNVFAHIKTLHAQASIPMAGERMQFSITSPRAGNEPQDQERDDKQGIHLMTVQDGEDASASVRGFHTYPRLTPHPTFGTHSRIRVIVDEAEGVPWGIWEGVDNILSSRTDQESIKVVAATNPKNKNCPFGQRAEPEGGWDQVSVEVSERWESRMGWTVCRLDAARCENVEQRRDVYGGLQSWIGYRDYLVKGDQSPEYYCMARGWWPVDGIASVVIPENYVSSARGTLSFVGPVLWALTLDPAFEGDDDAMAAAARVGDAKGWTDMAGKYHEFDKVRVAIQLEQLFPLKKGRTEAMGEQMIRLANQLKVNPSMMAVDRTGNGTGIHDYLRYRFGDAVMGLMFGEAATEKKVLLEDLKRACDEYDGLVTELYFATRKFLEFGYMKISPGVRLERLLPELSGRQYRIGSKGKVRVESKKEYKHRGNRKSPDEADAVTIMVHLVRHRSEIMPAMLATPEHFAPTVATGVVDELDSLTFD